MILKNSGLFPFRIGESIVSIVQRYRNIMTEVLSITPLEWYILLKKVTAGLCILWETIRLGS